MSFNNKGTLVLNGVSYSSGGEGGTSEGGSINVIDNLTSTNTSDALSANQGKVLNNNKQDKITSTNKLAYSLISGTPTIPIVDNTYSATSNNAMSGVAVASAINQAILGAIGGSY